MVLAIGRKLVLAGPLEAVEIPVERFVVWISEHGAHSGTFDALRAALVLGFDERLVRFTLLRRALASGAPDFTRAALARGACIQAPRFAVLIHLTPMRTSRFELGRHRARRTAIVQTLNLILDATLQHGAGILLAKSGPITALTGRTLVRFVRGPMEVDRLPDNAVLLQAQLELLSAFHAAGTALPWDSNLLRGRTLQHRTGLFRAGELSSVTGAFDARVLT